MGFNCNLCTHYNLKFRSNIKFFTSVFVIRIEQKFTGWFWSEGSSAYHRFTSGNDCLMYYQLNSSLKSDKGQEKLNSLLCKMYAVSMEFENPLSCHSLVGDSDGGSFNFLSLFDLENNCCFEKSPYNLKNHLTTCRVC